MTMSFDPHPYGCPVSVAAAPDTMTRQITEVYLQLRDLVHCKVIEINPRKGRGDSYPLLQLFSMPDDPKPRLVLFPAWEDNARRRRLDYGRQHTLLQRIHDAGVTGEDLEVFRGVVDRQRSAEPVVVRLAVARDAMTGLVNDLLEYLADLAKVMVVKVPHPRGEVLAVRIYGVGPEDDVARLLLVPAWGEAEGDDLPADSVLEHLDDGLREVPAEAFLL
jgi:hypothetical protein